MERDFMGLGVKHEPSEEETTDAGPLRVAPMQWPFSKKGSSSSSSLLSFNGVHEGKPNKTGFDSSQKNIVNKNQHGVRFLTSYPTNKNDAYAFQRSMFNQTKPLPTLHSNSPVVGTTDIRNASNGAAQLTIFYNGSVCVYENIAPDKAQAIMLLAGNGPSITQPAPIPRPNVLDGFVVSQSFSTPPCRLSPSPINPINVSQAYNSSTQHRLRPANVNPINLSQTYNSSTPHRLSPAPINPISVSSSIARPGSTTHRLSPAPINPNSVSSSVARPGHNNNGNVAKPAVKVMAFSSPDAVPQFRKKSLARFLEKRKERAITANPYGEKQSKDFSSIPGAGNNILSMNSSGSCPFPPNN